MLEFSVKLEFNGTIVKQCSTDGTVEIKDCVKADSYSAVTNYQLYLC